MDKWTDGQIDRHAHVRSCALIKYIAQRDGHLIKPNIKDIILFDGASAAINCVATCLISHPRDGMMIPIP